MINKFLITLIGTLLFMGCSTKNTEPEYIGATAFPLETGARWEYVKWYLDIPFADSAVTDTQTFVIYRRVIGQDTIINSTQTFLVDDSTFRDDPGVPPDSFVFRYWYGLSAGQLLQFASSSFLPGETPVPLYFSTPRVILDFPLFPGKAFPVYQTDIADIYSSVVGIENIAVGSGIVKCDVVRTRALDSNTGHQFFDSYWWYSNDGLIRSEIDYGVDIRRDELGNPIDSARAIEIMELIDYQING